MNTPSLTDETPVKNSAANLQRGIETVGGWLYLTSRRLVFESHAVNVQTGSTIIPLASLTGIQRCWTKFLNLIPLAPNSLAISTSEGEEYRFVTFGRQAWIDAIEDQRQRVRAEVHIVQRYANLLAGENARLLIPESSLPAPMAEVKKALIAEAKSFQARGIAEGVKSVRTSYVLLATFVPDAVALRNSQDDSMGVSDDMARLMTEFDHAMA